MQKTILFGVLCACLSLWACSKNNFVATDLKKYGVPLTVMAPPEVKVQSEDFAGGMSNVTLQKDRFDVQIIGLQSGASSASEFLGEKKKELTDSDPTFKILTDDADGMVYQTTLGDSGAANMSYNFYFVKQVAEQYFTFQTGFTALPTLAEANEMYAAMRAAK